MGIAVEKYYHLLIKPRPQTCPRDPGTDNAGASFVVAMKYEGYWYVNLERPPISCMQG